jgi:tetratricopeptide (TPR) repeat protein
MPDVPTLTAPADDDAEPVATAERYGPYEVIGTLGSGGMGVVLEARDPALHRHVALKILKPRPTWTASDGATRLVYEAQAMARLAHPNVVTVFEVGQRDGQVYVALELVRGTTLRNWLRERPRRWREILEIFLAAGRGLAAAHDAGLVHRDFKPDNVLIGGDGRPRVTDFGLVVESAWLDEAVLSELADGDSDTTFRGSVAGTPAYMSVEQWAGRGVDARTDQFAFCVALWEALCGERPFRGARPHEIRAAVQAGAIAPPPRGRAPRWLLALLRRGLARDPAARWPTMAGLLDAVTRQLRLRRARAIVAITAGTALAAAAATALVTAHRAIAPCEAPTTRLAAVWSEPQRDRLRTRLTAVDLVQGPTRYEKIAATLDARARDWSAMHVEACRATRVEGRQSDTLLDRRMQCLGRWLGELDSTVKVITKTATLAEVDRAARAATSLSSLDRCTDAQAMSEAPVPETVLDRATAAALQAQIQEVDVAQRAGQLDGLTERAAGLVAAARNLHHDPTLAAALAVQGQVFMSRESYDLAAPPLRELVLIAARTRDDRGEAFAWLNLAMAPGQANLIESARAAVVRAGEPLDLEIDLLQRESSLLDSTSRAAEALARLVRARQLLERAGADKPGSPLRARLAKIEFETGQHHLSMGRYDAATASYRAAIDLERGLYGADSIDEAVATRHLAIALQRAGKLDEAAAAADEAVRIYGARIDNSTGLVQSLVIRADILQSQQRWAASIEAYDRALQVDRVTRTPEDLTRAAILIGRSETASHFGKLDDAIHSLDEAIALFATVHGEDANLGIALFDRGDLHRRLGRYDEALRDLDRAQAVFSKTYEPSSHYLLYPLTGRAMALVLSGRPAEAIPLLERALRLKVDVGDALQLARAKAYLGRARVETGRDVPGGLALARTARAALAALPDGADDFRALDRWLAAHAR